MVIHNLSEEIKHVLVVPDSVDLIVVCCSLDERPCLVWRELRVALQSLDGRMRLPEGRPPDKGRDGKLLLKLRCKPDIRIVSSKERGQVHVQGHARLFLV